MDRSCDEIIRFLSAFPALPELVAVESCFA
jgi:hypothetical protein